VKHYGRQANVVVVFDQTGKVLVLRRSQTDPGNPGYWNFPGGYRDPDDKSAQEGAARELREESGIRLDPEKLNWAFSYRHPGLINVFWTQLPFRPKVRYTDSEHDAHCWVKLWEIPQPSLPHIRHIVEQITGKTWNLAPVDSTPSGGDALYYEPSTSDTSLGGPQMPLWNKSDYLARWPGYQPYPYALRRGWRPVPNQQSVDWPQAQFAPLYLPPGSPSFQPYSYNKNDVPLLRQEPAYNNINYGPYRQSGVGPGGDIARLPHGYGASVMNNPSQGVSFTAAERGDYTASVRDGHTASTGLNTQLPQGHHASRGLGKAKVVKLARIIKKLQRKRKTRKQRRQMRKAILMYRALKTELGTKTPVDFQTEQTRSKARLRAAFGQRQRNRNRGRTQNKKRQFLLRQAMAVEKAGRLPAPSLTAPLTVTKWGMSSSIQTIPTGVPSASVSVAPPSPYEDLTPLETVASDFGDGMAYELAPLTASAPYTEYGDLALENDGDGDCGCADSDGRNRGVEAILAVGLVGGVLWYLNR
jgi:8-oxo-dGTP pyrophosphatase MutT (NUDIX family)